MQVRLAYSMRVFISKPVKGELSENMEIVIEQFLQNVFFCINIASVEGVNCLFGICAARIFYNVLVFIKANICNLKTRTLIKCVAKTIGLWWTYSRINHRLIDRRDGVVVRAFAS